MHANSTTNAGGVAMYVSDYLDMELANQFNIDCPGCEELWIKVRLKTNFIFLTCVVYKHPKTSKDIFIDNLNRSLAKVNHEKLNCVVMGDINIDVQNSIICNKSRAYSDMLNSNAFQQVIDIPTRVTDSSNTIIDHVITNIFGDEVIPGVLQEPLTDHYPTFIILNQLKTKTACTIRYTRSLKNFEPEKYKNDLQQSLNEWYLAIPYLDENNFEETFCGFIECIKTTIDNHAPLVKLSRRQKRLQAKPWITTGILNSIKTKQKLHKSHYLSNISAKKSFYKRYTNILTRVKNLSKKIHYDDCLSSSKKDPRKTWKILGELLASGKSFDQPTCINHNNNEIYDPNQISTIFNNYFGNIGRNLAENFDNCNDNFRSFLFKDKRIANSIVLLSPSTNEILNELNRLKDKKTSGPDHLAPYFLKIASTVIAPYLAFMIEFMFNFGVFPDLLKIARVVPIFKTGDKKLVENYRPISILSSISKVIEKLLKFRILSFLNKHDVLYNRQNGFRKKFCTVYPILDILTECYDNINSYDYTCIITLDLKKAFDTVNHSILLHKLEHYGIRGNCHQILSSYLRNRKQFVGISDSTSGMVRIEYGVPQGSVLGPLLFIIYINDLKNALTSKPRLFADDTCLLIKNNNLKQLQEQGNKELNMLQSWMAANKLTINPHKSQIIVINPKIRTVIPKFSLSYGDTLIYAVKTTKYLGIEIDDQLNFLPYTQKLQKKLSRNVGVLTKLKHCLPKSALIALYYGIVFPHLLYGIIIWGSTYPTYLKKLQTIQNKAIRAISDSGWNVHVTPLYYEHKILKVNDIYKIESAKFMHKYVNKKLPDYFQNYFNKVSGNHGYSTRAATNDDLIIPFFRTNRCQKSFKYQGSKLWNSLPKNMTKLGYIKFIEQYKTFLISFYNSD